MVFPRPVMYLFYLVFIGFQGLPYMVSGQAKKYYNGSYNLLDYRGKAEFYYQIDSEDTVYDGAFLLNQSNIKALLSSQGDDYFKIKGFFQKGMAEENWLFEFGDFKSDGRSELAGNEYIIKAKGKKHTATGSLQNGKAVGTWTHSVEQLDSSKVQDTTFMSEIVYEAGVPQQSFKIQNQNETLLGRFLRDGLAHDFWDLYTDELNGLKERWFFEEGILREIVIIDNQKNDTLSVFSDSLTNEAIVLLDDRYTKMLAVRRQLKKDSSSNLSSRINNLLIENAAYYQKTDSILTKLGSLSFMPDFKVKVEFWPLDKKEENQLAQLQELIKEVDKVGNEISENTQLQILKLTNPEVSFLISTAEAIRKDYLSPVRTLLVFHSDNILNLLKRDNQLVELSTPRSLYEVNVPLEDGDQTNYLFTELVNKDFTGSGINGFLEITQAASKAIDSMKNSLEDRLTKQERKVALEALEKILVISADSLRTITDSLALAQNDTRISIENIQSVMTDNLRHYSEMTDFLMKINTAKQLIKCFNGMIALAHIVAEIPSKRREIQEIYTDRVWNPFTATLMDEEVKRRITFAYRDILIPAYLKQVSTDLNCGNSLILKQLIEDTNERMMQLIEEETTKLERKLKRKNDPAELKQLLGIQPMNTNQ
ncbi:MAG: hypothetical protein AAF600_08155 [Bacteroidota bacterium]